MTDKMNKTNKPEPTPEEAARNVFQPGKNMLGVLMRSPYEEGTPEFERFVAEWVKIEEARS